MSILILCLLVMLAAEHYVPLRKKAMVLHSAAYGLNKYKREIAIHWALEGHWPSHEDDVMRVWPAASSGRSEMSAESAVYENGAIHIRSEKVLFDHVLTCPACPLSSMDAGISITILAINH